MRLGDTTLSFAAHSHGESNVPGGHVHASSSPQPLGMEIALVTQDVAAALARPRRPSEAGGLSFSDSPPPSTMVAVPAIGTLHWRLAWGVVALQGALQLGWMVYRALPLALGWFCLVGVGDRRTKGFVPTRTRGGSP